MNKAELIDVMADYAGISKKDTEKALDSFIDTVSAEFAKR